MWLTGPTQRCHTCCHTRVYIHVYSSKMSHVCCHTRVYIHVYIQKCMYTKVVQVCDICMTCKCVTSASACASVTSVWRASVWHLYDVQVCDISRGMTSRMATCKCTTQSVQVYTQSARGLENVYMLYYRSATHCASAKCKSARGLQECVHKVYTSYKWVYTT